MEPTNQTTREQLCLEIIEQIIPEAKKDALASFKSFPKQVKTEMQFSANDEATVLINLLTIEYVNYDKILNIKDIKKFKFNLLGFLISSKEVYDEELNFNEEGYNAQQRRIKEQFLTLKKIKYLERIKDELTNKTIASELDKIEWLGTASEFGFLINELVSAGYMKKAAHKKEKQKVSWAHTSDLLFKAFYIPNLAKDGETSQDNLRKEISNPSLSDKQHGFFKISRRNKL